MFVQLKMQLPGEGLSRFQDWQVAAYKIAYGIQQKRKMCTTQNKHICMFFQEFESGSATNLSTSAPVTLPLSTRSTQPGHGLSKTSVLGASRRTSSLKVWLTRVPVVAKTPMTPLLVMRAAGLMAGSMPTKGSCG